MNDDGELELTEEELDLIKLYGPKIRVVRWYFENDSELQNLLSKKNGKASGQKKANESKAKKVPQR